MFHEEIRAAEPAAGRHADPGQPELLPPRRPLPHREQRAGRQVRHRRVPGADVVYGCQVVVTNPTSSPQKLTCCCRSPRARSPCSTATTRAASPSTWNRSTRRRWSTTSTSRCRARSRTTRSTSPRTNSCWPPRRRSQLEGRREAHQDRRKAWEYLSQNGTNEEVLEFLKTENLHRIDLEKIAFRMQDSDVLPHGHRVCWPRATSTSHTLWSYALQHNVPAQIREYLQHADDFVAPVRRVPRQPAADDRPGGPPHVPAPGLPAAGQRPRPPTGPAPRDRQRPLLQQYHSLLTILSYQRELNDDELMAVTYYLLLQDRVDEALGFFGRVNPDGCRRGCSTTTSRRTCDSSRRNPQQARAIVQRYADYPVDRWRDAFAAVGQQLDEIHGPADTPSSTRKINSRRRPAWPPRRRASTSRWRPGRSRSATRT